MTATKIPPKFVDNGPITAFQIKRIMQNCAYQLETKNEWVQWTTGDVNRTSLKSISHDQAIRILMAQTGSKSLNEPTDNWALFDNKNPKHKMILSLLRQMQWVNPSEKWGEVADLIRFSNFLKSEKSPVRKPLKKMSSLELEKIIIALNGIINHRYK